MQTDDIRVSALLVRLTKAINDKITTAAKMEGKTKNDYVLDLLFHDLKKKGLMD